MKCLKITKGHCPPGWFCETTSICEGFNQSHRRLDEIIREIAKKASNLDLGHILTCTSCQQWLHQRVLRLWNAPRVRMMTAAERAEMEKATRELDQEFDRLLEGRTPRFSRSRRGAGTDFNV